MIIRSNQDIAWFIILNLKNEKNISNKIQLNNEQRKLKKWAEKRKLTLTQ